MLRAGGPSIPSYRAFRNGAFLYIPFSRAAIGSRAGAHFVFIAADLHRARIDVGRVFPIDKELDLFCVPEAGEDQVPFCPVDGRFIAQIAEHGSCEGGKLARPYTPKGCCPVHPLRGLF